MKDQKIMNVAILIAICMKAHHKNFTIIRYGK
jgi:hypothetical protein